MRDTMDLHKLKGMLNGKINKPNEENGKQWKK